ncbi:Arc/MetJ-type ribon-helix-helix transcriptional regulator [Saccharopolyspora lacisalsi]|uniref:Arc/MetJ-type ribon-helix-helix transcriptional regulator n=1 Tax=Halosaccharopolyspora lacisalsi TaxID=1000566 RepID=A0A839E1C5_9PSEU|nr:ribbon-helix-helix protein, CopG family [Halosaccharopolyspora lacisalsi]MBA8825221.1 Arc/MetJ-type ribon-helix-helix transcriptional regulator [Halosaccharopolyspora lacisalsi]
MTLVQARVPEPDAHRLDDDAELPGLSSRSEAVREGLRLLHRRARRAALAQDYDAFYGTDATAPTGELAEIGDLIAAQTAHDSTAE